GGRQRLVAELRALVEPLEGARARKARRGETRFVTQGHASDGESRRRMRRTSALASRSSRLRRARVAARRPSPIMYPMPMLRSALARRILSSRLAVAGALIL